MISRKETKSFLEREPRFDDIMCSVQAVAKLPKGIVKETKKVVAVARKFNDEVIRPGSLDLDMQLHEDPAYLAWDFVKEANKWGFYSFWYPKMFGGKGYPFFTIAPFMEELASACLSMANLVGVHYLGVCTLAYSLNTRLINKLFKETVEGEKTGNPCIFSTAITEPDAGTDVEEVELIDKGNVTCHAKRVEGGFLVNGTKIFISSGHLSTWHLLIAYTDINTPSGNMIMFAVRNGTKGFSFGKVEKKMGQKGCPASELVFSDCFIPDEYVCADIASFDHSKLTPKEVSMVVLDDVLAISRTVVGAFGVGAARGAYEEALKFSAETKVNGRLLINHEWAQSRLAEMYKNVANARATYLASNYANAMYSPLAAMQFKPAYYCLKYTPRFFWDKILAPWFDKPFSTWLMRKLRYYFHKESLCQVTSGLGALAKFAGTDAGVKNCHMALEMMGQAGLRHDQRAEKILRDAKLLQIYEGTNQLNRLNLFKCLIGQNYPQTVVFDE